MSIFVATLFWPMPLVASPAQANSVYLPIVVTPIRVSSLQFVTSNECNADFSNPQISPATFTYGVRQLGVSATVEGGLGQAWHLEWSLNGTRVLDLDRHDVITQLPQIVSTMIVYGANRQCGTALPQGTYQVRLFLNDVLYQVATVNIQ